MACAFCACAQNSLFDSAFKTGLGEEGLVTRMILQPDGKIVVGGSWGEVGAEARTNLARLEPSGEVDAAFPAGTDDTVNALRQQSDGKILVGGRFSILQGEPRSRVGRILTNGLVDLSFDAGEFLAETPSVLSLALQPDGKVLVGAQAGPENYERIDSQLFRVLSSGTPDESFVQTNSFRGWYLYAIQPLSNGNILVGGGFTNVNGFPVGGLALLSSNGVVDTNFQCGLDVGSTVFSITKKPDGKFLLGGNLKASNTNTYVAIAQLTADLQWDTSFNPDAFAPTVNYPGTHGYVRSITIQPDGKIIVGGDFSQVGGYWRYRLARLDETGKVDPCFDAGLGLSGFYGVIDTILQPDGKVLVGGGFTTVDGKQQANIARAMPASVCGATIVHLNTNSFGGLDVAATCSPGGYNTLECSTNLVDWFPVAYSVVPFITAEPSFFDMPEASAPAAFFRVKIDFFEAER